ncbi:unnamed protein product [Linum tenue]|uniref:Uncharacterized protein n=1 Tax=Linum tenue TaxID=586396 RepID=A0AAV0KIX1_9ROSI|nr:unnamed protein product [Linum tenue]
MKKRCWWWWWLYCSRWGWRRKKRRSSDDGEEILSSAMEGIWGGTRGAVVVGLKWREGMRERRKKIRILWREKEEKGWGLCPLEREEEEDKNLVVGKGEKKKSFGLLGRGERK